MMKGSLSCICKGSDAYKITLKYDGFKGDEAVSDLDQY